MTFSLLISVYSKEKPEYFDQAFLSIWDQQILKPDQIVLVKDGPLNSELDALVEQWQAKLGKVLTVVALPSNIGLGGALNEGLQYCCHDLVARMDTDDASLTRRFECQVAMFENNPDLDVAGGFVIEIDANGNLGALRSMPITHEGIMASLWTCPLIHPTVMFRREKLFQVGAYDSTLRRRQDYELWFRCAQAGFEFGNIPEPLILYRFDHHTHKKQPLKIALEQALIGYRGATLIGMAYWKRLACFIPFLRAMFPASLQHFAYRAMRRFDPRQSRSSGGEQ